MGGLHQSGPIIKALQHLTTHGWITLRAMAPMLGYAHPTGIYGRQAGRKAIPTVHIGGTYRVYADAFIATLENAPEQDQEAAKNILDIYRAMLRRQKEKEENA